MTTQLVRKDGRWETSVKSIKEDGEVGVGLEELFDEREIKDVFEHIDIVFY